MATPSSAAPTPQKGTDHQLAGLIPGFAAGATLSQPPVSKQWAPSLQHTNPSKECLKRVRNDIKAIWADPLPGIFVCPDDTLTTVVHGLIVGPFDTPYEGGFFHFVLQCPDDYPHSPPAVRLMTTGGGVVRFNPNLYASGKVCLSILGTWTGPGWTPVCSLSSVLVSIQSIMNDKPYHNEPGYEKKWDPKDVQNYSDCVQHETLRVAVCSMVGETSQHRSLPWSFQPMVRDLFPSFKEHYDAVCAAGKARDGQSLVDPFGFNRGTFQYGAIQQQIQRIHDMITAAAANSEEPDPGAP